MTKPFVPIMFEVVTSSVSVDPSNSRHGLINFVVGGNLYSFAIDRAALQRLELQIGKVLQQIPPLPKKRKPREQALKAPVRC